MKRSLLITIVVLLMAALFVSCNANKVEEDQLFEVTVDGGSRALSLSGTFEADAENLYWYYTATKTSGMFNNGTQTWKAVKAGKGLANTSLGDFSKGGWSFSFYGFTAEQASKPENPATVAVFYQEGLTQTIYQAVVLNVTLARGTGALAAAEVSFAQMIKYAAAGASLGANDVVTLKVYDGTDLKVTKTGAVDSESNKYAFTFATADTFTVADGAHTLHFVVYDQIDNDEPYIIGQSDITFTAKNGMKYVINDVSGIDYIDEQVGASTGSVTVPVLGTDTITASTTDAVVATVPNTPVGTSTVNTTVSFPAASFTGSPELAVETYSAEVASTKFNVTSSDAVVAGINLSLTQENGTAVTTFENVANEYVTVTTYIEKNLTDVKVLYNGSEYINGTSGDKYLEDGGYTPATGKLVFRTNHFSEFVVLANGAARIGSKYYGTLDAAFDAAVNGDTVTVASNVELTFANECALTIGNGKAITLDLNGKTISGTATRKGTSYLLSVPKDSALTIVDSGTEGCITYKSNEPDPSWGYGTYTICNYGLLILEGGKIVNTTVGGASYAVENHNNWVSMDVTFIMEGGVLKCDNGDQAVRIYANNGNATCTGRSVMIMNGGTIESGGIWCDMPGSVPMGISLTILGGTINGKLDFLSRGDKTEIEILGGTFNCPKLRIRANNNQTEDYIKISGGNWTIDVIDNQNSGGATENTMAISGGTFSIDPSAYLAEGYVAAEANGLWTIGLPVVTVGGKGYASLESAIAAVPATDEATTVVVLEDIVIAGNAGITIPTGKNVILDLNGHVVKNAVNENKASQVFVNKGTLTIKDSTDTAKNGTGTGLLENGIEEGTQPGEWWSTPQYNYATNVITNSGTLTIESGKIEQTAAGSICYAIDNNSTSFDANIILNGGLVTDKYGTVIRLFCNSTTKENTITIKGGSVTTVGKTPLWIQLPGSKGEAKKATLNISGGTLTGKTYAFYDTTDGDVYTNVNYTITGGTFNGDIYSYGANSFEISGGEFNGRVYSKATISISGGVFNASIYNNDYLEITGGVFPYEEWEAGTAENSWKASDYNMTVDALVAWATGNGYTNIQVGSDNDTVSGTTTWEAGNSIDDDYVDFIKTGYKGVVAADGKTFTVVAE